jgi:tetratricopeptide (TPR) repeat protein
LFGFGNREPADTTESLVAARKTGFMAFLKRRINPVAADRAEKYARLEARVASDTATGEHFNQFGDMKLEKGLLADALELYKRACDQFIEEDLIVKAIAVAKKILKQFPEDPCVTEMYVQLGELNQQRGMIANAKEAYLVAAQRYQEASAIPDALRVFQRLADLLPDNVDLNADLARMYAKEGMGDEAANQFARTATRLLQTRDYKLAKELCLASLGQKAGHREALQGLLQIAFHEQDYKEADAYVHRLGSYMESDWELLKAYGDLLVRQDRYDEAIVQYEKAVTINPMNQDLAAAVEQLRRGEGARPPATTATEPDSPAAPPVFDLDTVHAADFDPSELVADASGPSAVPESAAETAAVEDAVVPTESEASSAGAVELDDFASMFDGAADATGAASTSVPSQEPGAAAASPPEVDPDFQKRLTEARFYEELGMEDEAKEVYAALLADHPDHPALVEVVARLGLGLPQAPPATDEEEQGSASAVDTPPAPSDIGSATDAAADEVLAGLLAEADIYLSGTLFDDAIAVYQRILVDYPGHPDALAGLATARSLSGDPEIHQQEQNFEDGIEAQMTNLLANLVGEVEADDEDPALHMEMAWSYLEMDMVDEAWAELQLVMAASAPPVDHHLALARCHAMRGEQDDAVHSYQAYLEAASDGVHGQDARYELALILLERGEWPDARHHLQILVQADPAFRDAQELLDGIAVE